MPEIRMKMPALAVVGPDRRIVRSTETFRQRYEDAEKMWAKSPELDRVLTGGADVATLALGDVSVEIEAVTDDAGCRQAMLTLPSAETVTAPEPPVSALHDAAEESPAMVWVKDLDGRYLFANRRFVSDLGTSEERLYGKADRELKELETVDGPRLRYADGAVKEPLQLEYTIPAIDRRPALAVFRFPLRNENGEPVGTCGVAAPVAETGVARDESLRLMALERWNRLDPLAARAEVLEQWHVHTARVARLDDTNEPLRPAWDVLAAAPCSESVSRPTEATAAQMPAPPPAMSPGSAAPILADTAELLQTNLELVRTWASQTKGLQGQLHEAQAAAVRANEQADRLRAELEQTRGDLDAARAEADALREPAATALKVSDELEQTLARVRERLGDLEPQPLAA